MNVNNLLEKYPNLIEKVREWDCDYATAIKRLEEQKKSNTLEKYF